MEIRKIFSYLAYPSKHEDEQPEIGGASIPQKGRLYQMLKDIFDKSDQECNIPICFRPDGDGKQNNACRSEIIEMIDSPTLTAGRRIAGRLQQVTTGKSGMGLLFVVVAEDVKKSKIMLSRFPADQGVMAEQSAKTLKVQFIEQVFLKNANAYKSVIYEGPSTAGGFWKGYAVDKQTNHGLKDVANYWIRDFLLSEFETTSKAGTKRLAVALRDSISKSEELATKHEITSAAVLARNMEGKSTSVEAFCSQYHLSEPAKALIKRQLRSSKVLHDRFQFDAAEFVRHLSYKSLEMDSGAILTAPLERFEQCFQEEDAKADHASDARTFRTTGKVVNEILKKGK